HQSRARLCQRRILTHPRPVTAILQKPRRGRLSATPSGPASTNNPGSRTSGNSKKTTNQRTPTFALRSVLEPPPPKKKANRRTDSARVCSIGPIHPAKVPSKKTFFTTTGHPPDFQGRIPLQKP